MPQDAFTALSLCNNATLRRATRKLGQFYDDVLAPSGLKATQQGLLYQIHVGEEPAMGAIAAALIMDLSALGHTLKPLIRDGYIETFADPDDRRIKRVRLTPQGLAKLDEAMKLWQRRPAAFRGHGRQGAGGKPARGARCRRRAGF